MKVNDKIIYLTFIEIEKLLDKSKIEYQSLDNRIEFYANNDAQVIIDSDDTNITVDDNPETVSTYTRRYGDHINMTEDTASRWR